MWRRALCLLLLLQLVAGGRAPAQAPPLLVGYLIASRPEVFGGIPPRTLLFQRQGNGPPPAIVEGMRVQTRRRGTAEIALQRLRRGKVRLGPSTVVLFDERVIEGRRPVMTVRQEIGQLRLHLVPRGKEPGEGEYWIETEAGIVRVSGTDVAVRAGKWGMVVAVMEGEVEVEGRTGAPPLTLLAGEWTYVPMGRPPAPARPIPPADGGAPPANPPGELFPFDPPQVEFLRQRFDLPR